MSYFVSTLEALIITSPVLTLDIISAMCGEAKLSATYSSVSVSYVRLPSMPVISAAFGITNVALIMLSFTKLPSADTGTLITIPSKIAAVIKRDKNFFIMSSLDLE